MKDYQVKMRVSFNEKELWQKHAAEIGISLSEYIRQGIEFAYFGGIKKEVIPVGFWRRVWLKMLSCV
jgi:hypothetical protein